jgi:SAM-dependent methyltransferase
MNIRKMVGEIHAKAQQESTGFARGPATLPEDVANELSILLNSYERLYQMRGLVGQMPPAPDTARARIGAHLIRAVQRILFWYTPQIHRVQQEVTNTIGSLCKLIETQMETIAALRGEVAALHRARDFETSAATRNAQVGHSDSGSGGAAIPAAFEFALQDRFRGSEGDTRHKLEEWLGMIRIAGSDSDGPWLDIGCGRGEWLALASGSGRRVCGIDANPVAVEYCRNQGLCAEVADGFDHLRARPDASLGVVTMFHVVEHLPAGYLLDLLSLVFQKLGPGGLIAIETPNPGNVLMGAHYFWNDPTHVRPLPEALLTFMLEYTGFSIARRAGMNPFPPHDHLRWTEIDVVSQLDNLLYGARDYGVLGRK